MSHPGNFWLEIPLEGRALLAYALSISFFVFLFTWAPADDWRVLALALMAGLLNTALLYDHIWGWELFSASSALALAGAIHSTSPVHWLGQALWVGPALLSWYLGGRLGRDLSQWSEDPEGAASSYTLSALRREERRGWIVVGATGLGLLILLTPLAEGSLWLAFPLGLLLTLGAAWRWRLRRPFWPSLGLTLALPLIGWINLALRASWGSLPPSQPDPWLVGGRLGLGASLALWLAQALRYPRPTVP